MVLKIGKLQITLKVEILNSLKQEVLQLSKKFDEEKGDYVGIYPMSKKISIIKIIQFKGFNNLIWKLYLTSIVNFFELL